MKTSTSNDRITAARHTTEDAIEIQRNRIQQWQEGADFSVTASDAGIIARLYAANLVTMKSMLQVAISTDEANTNSTKRLWRVYGQLQEWGSYHSVAAGALDRDLQTSTELRDNAIELLAGVGEILSKGM